MPLSSIDDDGSMAVLVFWMPLSSSIDNSISGMSTALCLGIRARDGAGIYICTSDQRIANFSVYPF